MPPSSINNTPAPVYLVSSSEPLLIRDWLDHARKVLREAGFEDIQTHTVEAGFDWNALLDEGDMMSLFATKKCRILALNSGKPGQAGSKGIQALCTDLPPDSVYIFVVPGLDKRSKSSSWYKNIADVGEIVTLAPVYPNQLVDWILQRSAEKSLKLDRESAIFLAERSEGNLLAADQELEKLSIRFTGQSTVSHQVIEESVAHSARYTHFLLIDACLEGKMRRALKILLSLQAEGVSSVQLRWSFQSTLEQLVALKQAQNRQQLNNRTWQSLQIWSSKQRLFQKALARLEIVQIERLIQSCATLDRLGKGQQDRDYPDQEWAHIRTLISDFCGFKFFIHE